MNLALAPTTLTTGMQPDRLGHHAAPPGLERAQDVALRLGRRRGGEEEGILELESR